MRIRAERPADCNFSEEQADRAIDFFNQYLVHTKGQWSGQPFNLRPWQEIDIREIFGRVNDDGARQIRQVYFEIPKKCGKSEMAAGIANKLLFADSEEAAEVYGAAADRDQASIVFGVAAAMVARNPTLRKRAKIIPSTKRIIVGDSFYRAVSSDVGTKHGFNSHGVIFDEVHAQKDSRLWEALTFGAGDTREQPLTFAITTAGIPGESPVAEMLHEDAEQILRGVIPCPRDFYPVIYKAPDDARWDDEEVWRACNPALGDFLNIESVRIACESAKRRPSEQNSFRRLRLNQWVKSETRWIDLEAWDACNGIVDLGEIRELPCYAGLDLSTKLDLTALVLVFISESTPRYHVLPFFWIPKDSLRQRHEREGAHLERWIEQGLIEATNGPTIDFRAVRRRLNEIAETVQIQQIAFDPTFATQLSLELASDGFQMVEVRQGFRHLSEPLKELEGAVLSRNLRHGGNPVLRWMADCVQIQQNIDGAVRPVKPDRLASSKRIDGIVALAMAMSRAMFADGGTRSVYEDRGIYVV